jgi:hypothetical protein
MTNSRRHLLVTTFAGALGLLLRAKSTIAQSQTRPQPPSPTGEDESPNAPGTPSANKAMLEQRQKDIKKEIEKLFDLASKLKAEVEKTDATSVLSLAIVKKAEEIEHLAKQIKDNAKG